MDILTWGVKNQHKKPVEFVIKVLYWILIRVFPEYLGNGLACRDLVGGLPRLGYPMGQVSYHTLVGKVSQLHGILEFGRILLFGNEKEIEDFTRSYHPAALVTFKTANTLVQAKELVRYCQEHGITDVQLLAKEIHVTRSWLTVVKQILIAGKAIRVMPGGFLDKNRPELILQLQLLGATVEAIKLSWYQKKGDVASLLEAEEYIKCMEQYGPDVVSVLCIFC